MELVEGERLDACLARPGIDLPQAVGLLLQVCEAVAAAHGSRRSSLLAVRAVSAISFLSAAASVISEYHDVSSTQPQR